MPSPSATSHSSRSQLPGAAVHQAPDVRQGPALRSTGPPGMPRRSIATLHRPAALDGDAHRHRRPEPPQHRRERRRIAGLAGACAVAVPRARLSCRRRVRRCLGRRSPLRRRQLEAAHLEPIRPMRVQQHRASRSGSRPTSAPRRAVSVATVSADGTARSSSEYWITRPGAGSISIVTMSTAAGGGCDSRSSISSVRSTRASRIAAGSCSTRACTVRSTSRRSSRSAAAPRSARSSVDRQRIEQPRQHERQRLQRVDRPLQLHPLDEARHVRIGHERPGIAPQRQLLQPHAVLPHARRQIAGVERRELSERRQPPAPRHVERALVALPRRIAARVAWSRRRSSVVPSASATSCCRCTSGSAASAAATSSDDDRQLGVRQRQQQRRRHGRRDRHPDRARPVTAAGRSRELRANRRRLAEQTAQPRDVAHDAARAVPLQPRRELARDVHDAPGSGRGAARRQANNGSGFTGSVRFSDPGVHAR